MPSTPVYGLRYQSLTDSPDGASLGEDLATDVEAELVRIDAAAAVGTRIATNIRTSDSAGVTVESGADSVTGDLIAGRTYKVTWACAVTSSTSGDSAFVRIRQDNTAGLQLQIMRVYIPATGGVGTRYPAVVEAEYTPAADETKTFAGTIARASGAGNISVHANATFPVYMYIDYVRG